MLKHTIQSLVLNHVVNFHGIVSPKIATEIPYLFKTVLQNFSTKFWGMNPTNSILIPRSLVLRSIVLG